MKKITKDKLWKASFLIVLFLSGSIVGWGIHELSDMTRKMDGLRFELSGSHNDSLNFARRYDSNGNWVCVNVKGMSYERGVEVCKHEMAHEIFAGIIEKNESKINEVMNLIS